MTKAARELHENMRVVEEADDISMKMQLQLRKILFKKKTVVMGGFKRQYCASRNETVRTIKKLLKIRRDFMATRGLHDAHPMPGAASRKYGLTGGASQPADHCYLFTDEDRWEVMQEWKLRFHGRKDQVEQQKRDSWKPTGPPTDAQHLWGPNAKAVRSGKDSRFARHLQITAGSKTMAELIIYTGRFDPEFLNQAQDTQDPSGASQPVANSDGREDLKRKAAQAKLDYRMTCILRRRLDRGHLDERDLQPWEKKEPPTAARRLPASPHERRGGRVCPRDAPSGGRRDTRNRRLDSGRHALPPRRMRRARRRLLLGQQLRGGLDAAVLLGLR